MNSIAQKRTANLFVEKWLIVWLSLMLPGLAASRNVYIEVFTNDFVWLWGTESAANLVPYPLVEGQAIDYCNRFFGYPPGGFDQAQVSDTFDPTRGVVTKFICDASRYPDHSYRREQLVPIASYCPAGMVGMFPAPTNDGGITRFASGYDQSRFGLGVGRWCTGICPDTPSESDPEYCLLYLLWAQPESNVQPKQCNKSDTIGDPIDPASGSMIKMEGDCSSTGGSLSFGRYYDSQDTDTSNVGGWHGRFSRRIGKSFVLAPPAPARALATGNPDRSGLYLDPEQACLQGFVEIQSRVPNASGATTQYVDGICQLIKNGLVIGSMPVYTNRGIPKVSTTELPVSFDVVRDDGQTIRFWKQNGVLRSAAGVTLRLVPTSTGYLLFDSNDNVENYDTNGVLVAVQSRNGTTQTMGYTSGKLTSVTDDFGHKLIFTYDAQNRLISTTRQ